MNLWIVVTQVEITVVLTLLQNKEGLGSNLMCVPALYHIKRVIKKSSGKELAPLNSPVPDKPSTISLSK